MAVKLIVLVFTILIVQTYQKENDEPNPLAEAISEVIQNQNLQGLGAMVGNLLQSGALNSLTDNNNNKNLEGIGNIIQGLGGLLGANGGQGIDTNMISGILDMVTTESTPKKKTDNDIDVMSLLGSVGNVLAQNQNMEMIASYAPIAMKAFNDFFGPEAKKRTEEHDNHSWKFPPVLEKFHVLADLFTNSDIGKMMLAYMNVDKVMKIFSDEKGNFDYDKFIALIENQSFRRHWIHAMTKKIEQFLQYYGEPKVYTRYITYVQSLINNLLKSQFGFPKTALLDKTKPTESITAFVNYSVKKWLDIKVDSKQYVKPAVNYLTDVVTMAHQKGILSTRSDSIKLSDKLTDTINLEIIEPVSRVNRGYKFIQKNPTCDKYTLCLVNQNNLEVGSLPGLKQLLSRSTSLFAGWMLSDSSVENFNEFYDIVINTKDCSKYFKPECSDFHDEEVKVTTEYVHNEL